MASLQALHHGSRRHLADERYGSSEAMKTPTTKKPAMMQAERQQRYRRKRSLVSIDISAVTADRLKAVREQTRQSTDTTLNAALELLARSLTTSLAKQVRQHRAPIEASSKPSPGGGFDAARKQRVRKRADLASDRQTSLDIDLLPRTRSAKP